jgi:hypothetical protein
LLARQSPKLLKLYFILTHASQCYHIVQGAKPNSSSGRLSDREDSKRDIDSRWTHDKFAKHNGIEGGELGARIKGNVGRQITSGTAEQPNSRILSNAFAGIGGRQEAKKKAVEEPPLVIRGASSTTGVEVEGLAPGTTAEDVAVRAVVQSPSTDSSPLQTLLLSASFCILRLPRALRLPSLNSTNRPQMEGPYMFSQSMPVPWALGWAW